MRTTLKGLKKKLDDKDRARKASVLSVVADEAKALAEANLNAKILVHEFEAYSNTKVRIFYKYIGFFGKLSWGVANVPVNYSFTWSS